MSCGITLSAAELVPILSWLVQRGKCRHCGASIGPRQVWIEMAAALWGALALIDSPDGAGMAGALFGWQLLALAVMDAEHFRLPRILTSLLALTGLAAAAIVPQPDLLDRLYGAAAGFVGLWLVGAAYLHLRGRRGLGGGDPWMLGAVGCWLGWQALPLCILGAALVGLGWLWIRTMRGDRVRAADKLPLGTLMAVSAAMLWLTTNQS
jgi:leader peptidase (prepilin peptidase)/N-methyltransferase